MSYPIVFDASEKKWTPAIAGKAIAGITTVGSLDKNDPFSSLGLGTLVDAISCTVTEERNGSYELEMQYSITGVHFKELKQRNFILAKPNYIDPPQPFRIYKITKPLNKICTIYARHISYDLSGYEVEGGLSASYAPLAFRLLNQRARNFNITGQSSRWSEFKTDVPASVRSWFGGKEGSLIDLYGGEWHYNGYDCTLMTNRGADRGVTIRYGKNLTTLTQDEECSNVYSAVRAYYKDEANDILITSNLISTGITLDQDRILFLDCSSDYQEQPTVEDLNSRATSYIQSNNLQTPDINLTLDFVQMQGFDRVDLCDTVTVEFEQLGVSAKAKCIQTTWNVLRDRYDSISLGDAKSTLADTVATISQEVGGFDTSLRRTTSSLISAIDKATAMITGNLGGYVVLHDSDNDGYPDEILIMDSPDINYAVNIWRWNKSGLGFSSTGYSGNFGLAMTADGRIVADFIKAGTMSANHIKGGALSLGGEDDVNGILEVFNADGDLVGTWTKDGINVLSGSIIGDLITAGKITSANGSVYFDLDNNVLQCTQLQGPYISYYPSGQDAGNTRINIERRYVGNYYQCFVHIYNTKVSDKGLRLIPAGYKASSNVANYSTIESDEGADGLTMTCSGTSADQPFLKLTAYDSGNSSSTGLINLQRKTNGYGIQITASGTNVVGNFSVSGTKSREIETDAYGKQLLYAYETPVPLFADVGEGVIGEDGLCYVWLDPIFASTINSDHYQVFLQKYGDGDCWIQERKAGCFVVKGTPGLAFGWEIKARQVDATQKRMNNLFEYEVPSSDMGEQAAKYINDLYEGRKTA